MFLTDTSDFASPSRLSSLFFFFKYNPYNLLFSFFALSNTEIQIPFLMSILHSVFAAQLIFPIIPLTSNIELHFGCFEWASICFFNSPLITLSKYLLKSTIATSLSLTLYSCIFILWTFYFVKIQKNFEKIQNKKSAKGKKSQNHFALFRLIASSPKLGK